MEKGFSASEATSRRHLFSRNILEEERPARLRFLVQYSLYMQIVLVTDPRIPPLQSITR
jgi:hypothetical protein